MQRPLPPGENPVRLFSTNFDKEMYNSALLIDQDGDLKSYHALDEVSNCSQHLMNKLPVPKTLHLKNKCPVMLVKNLCKNLVNGLQGTVIEMKKDSVIVRFNSTVAEIKKSKLKI